MPSGSELSAFLFKQIHEGICFFQENNQPITLLLGKNGDPHFIKKVEAIYISVIKEQVVELVGDHEEGHHYEILFLAHGIISTVEEWLVTGAKETPTEIAKLIASSFFKTPIEMLGIKRPTAF